MLSASACFFFLVQTKYAWYMNPNEWIIY